MSKTNQNRIVMSVLVVVFLTYNFFIYTGKGKTTAYELSEKALAGESLWQKNNCASCYQLYGLGGYLGPDLTNLTSNPMRNDTIIYAFLNGGIGAMPQFNFSQEEKNQLLTFLKSVDSTGYYPVKNPSIESDGWVKLTYK